MRNAVRFKTAKFNTTAAKDYFINDICFGDDLSGWLCENLKKRGLTAADPWQEDWGWQFEAERALVSVGFDGDEWQIYFDPVLSFWERLKGKKVDMSVVTRAAHEVLKSEKEISEIRWFESDRSGQETDFAAEP